MFASWKLSLPQVPQRTRLYPLEPVGVGTAMVESMTGYVMRLAEAHAVPVGALINHELAQRKASTERHSTRAYCSLPYYANGSNQCAAGWVQALEAETYRTNLSLLTFLPLGESFCTRYIFRGVRAWCPACYEQWRTFDRTIYEPPVVERAAGRGLFSSPESFGRNLPPLPKVDEASGLHLSDWLLR